MGAAPATACQAAPQAGTQAGFTLVEVLVALFIFSVVALMSWQGLDALLRTRDGVQTQTEASMQRINALGQWEADLSQLHPSGVVPTLQFDGSALRLTRSGPDGVQVVLWMVNGGKWWRWASPPTNRALALHQAWEQSRQWVNIAPQALSMLEDIGAWQVYYQQRGDAGWSNAQSTGDVLTDTGSPPGGEGSSPPPGAPAPAPNASAATGADGGESPPAPPPPAPAGGASNPAPGTGGPQRLRVALPAGMRLVLTLPNGELLRDLRLPPNP